MVINLAESHDLLPMPTGPLVIHPATPTCGLSLIIPTYNEAANVEPLIAQLTQVLNGQSYEIILVDDDSPDRTWETALALKPDYPHLHVMRRQGERGLSTAVIRGWQVAQGEVLAVIDGDLQHPPEQVAELYRAIDQGADLAVASRHVAGGGISDWGIARRMLSRGAQILGLLMLPNVVGRVSDPMSGYFMVRRSAITDIELDPKGYKILLEVIGRGDVGPIAEVGYIFQERQLGESKVTPQQWLDYLHHLAKLRSRGRITALKQRFPIERFLRFGLVGLSGVVVDMLLFYLLSDPTMLGWGLTRSKMLASEIAIVNNFCWNDRWTFKDLAQTQSKKRQTLRRFLKFNTICLMGMILNILILNLLYNVFGLNRYLGNFLAIALVTAWNFWINLKLSWRVTDVQE
jgi:dolichol-phosphate mannosyltransferase